MNRKSLQEIYEQTKAGFAPFDLRFGTTRVLSHVISAATHMLHGYARSLSKNQIPDSEDEKILKHWCALYGIEQKPATKSEIIILAQSTAEVFLEPGAKWQHESGAVFSLKNSITVINNQEISVVCTVSGTRGNLEPGDELTITATTPNLKSSARVIKLSREGFDTETLPSLRSRLRERLRRPPQGGCPYDYINWALEHTAVSRAWVLPRHDENGKEKNGHVLLAAFKNSGALTNRERLEIEEDIKTKCPVSAIPHVVPIKTKRLNLRIEIQDDETTSEATLKSKIKKEISFMLTCLAAPKGFLNKNLKRESGAIYLSDITRSISLIPEIKNHRIISPTDHIKPTETGQIIVLGEVRLESI